VLIGGRHTDKSSWYGVGLITPNLGRSNFPTHSMPDYGTLRLSWTMSIMYDIRNPLDEDRPDDIDEEESYRWPAAACPRVQCPWNSRTDCLFIMQWRDKRSPTAPHMIANEQATGTAGSMSLRSNHPLASSIAPFPPAGEYADAHSLDDSDTEEAQATPTLHHHARRAAYNREAVSWQRFWDESSSKLTSLSELNVRMPRCLDKVGSPRLAKLLDEKYGWRFTFFADEREHMQTREDLIAILSVNENEFSHIPEQKIWHAGRFVRRTWVSFWLLPH
jgi:hypothetical protein